MSYQNVIEPASVELLSPPSGRDSNYTNTIKMLSYR